ncbi:MAG: aldose 1-epimerase [Ectothiorhodospiraceae bacterium]|nr:aldose 1-epimerase [Ectothiorhodospiraceae bacterium]
MPGQSTDALVTLRADALVLDLAPAVGGVIVGLRLDDRLLMRAPQVDAVVAGNPRVAASWPLVPWSNRIRDARFPWAGQPVTLASGPLGGRHAIHGVGWTRPWSVTDRTQRRVVLTHDHDADAHWPFAYAATQVFELEPRQLTLRTTLTNRDRRPMPAGIGHHPYFHRTADARLTVATGEVWAADPERLPTARIPVPAAMDFSGGREVDRLDIDAVYVGWTRPARIDWPAAGLALEIDADAVLDRLVVYIPPGEAFFAVEPVSHDTDAFNRPGEDTGIVVLGPEESMEATIRFRVTESS